MNVPKSEVVGVVLFNDHKTPMEFVVALMQQQFGHDQGRAIDLMLKVHREGFAVIDTTTRADAARKLAKAQAVIEERGCPLVIRMVDDPSDVIALDGEGTDAPDKVLAVKWMIMLVVLAAAMFALLGAFGKCVSQ